MVRGQGGMIDDHNGSDGCDRLASPVLSSPNLSISYSIVTLPAPIDGDDSRGRSLTRMTTRSRSCSR